MLSFVTYRARFELLCMSQLFHTRYVFLGGKSDDIWKKQVLQEETKDTGSGTLQARMQFGQCVCKLACLGVYKTDKTDGAIRYLWVVEGWQGLGQYLGNNRINAQNLATCLGTKSRSS